MEPSLGSSIREYLLRGKEILLTYALMFLPGMVLGPALVRGDEYNRPGFHLAYLLQVLPQLGLIVYLVRNLGNRDPAKYGLVAPGKKSPVLALGIFLGMVPLFLGAALLLRLLETLVPAASGGITWSFTAYEVLPLALVTCILTGYREELYFRAYLLPEFEALGLSPRVALTISTLLFSLGHGYQGLRGLLVAALLGAYLGLVYRRYGDLHALAWAHGAYNMAVLLVSGAKYM